MAFSPVMPLTQHEGVQLVFPVQASAQTGKVVLSFALAAGEVWNLNKRLLTFPKNDEGAAK